MHKTYTWLIVLVLLTTGVFADITWTGDARVRPRIDVKDNGEFGNTTTDKYYMYRARLLISADIGEGYFFKTRLGTNGYAYWSGKFGTGNTIPGQIPSAGRASVDFMELYFGHKGDTFGWSAGLIPIPHNPLKDIHFYPKTMVDIPWVVYSNTAAHGFNFNYKLAGNKLDLNILVDNNAGIVIDDIVDSLDLTTTDQYTINGSYPIKMAGLKITPEFLMTIANENDAAPLTYGATLGLPKFAGFGVTLFGALSNQTVADSLTDPKAYKGWIGRVKLVGSLGPGKVTAWYDIAQTTPDYTDAISTDFSYIWISYSYTLHKSEKGAVTLAPTYRLYTQKIEGSKDYNRARVELTTQITFK